MLGKSDKNPQLNITGVPLLHFINPDHDLCTLAKKVKWEAVEKDFARYYSKKGAPSVPIRIMIGIILLKNLFRYSDRNALLHWVDNPYWQHFCGEVYFQHKAPFYYSDFSAFRRRIGAEGDRKILQLGSEIFGNAMLKSPASQHSHDATPAPMNRISRIAYYFGNYLLNLSSGK